VPHADLALAERCRANEPGAFEDLYRAHAPRLFGLAYRLVGPGDAEDLLKETFLTAYRQLDSYRGESSLGTWLFRIATHACLGHLKRRPDRTGERRSDETLVADTGGGAVLDVVDRIDLERALTELPVGWRAAFVLHDVEGFGYQEMASLLGITPATARSHLHRARLYLRQRLARREVDAESGRA